MKHKRLPLVAGATALALAGCDNPTASTPTQAGAPNFAMIVYDHIEDLVFGFSGCSGDDLAGKGKIHTVISETVDAAGGLHVSFKEQFSNVRLTGSPSGASYTASQTVSDNATFKAGQEATFNQTLQIIGRSKTPNLVLHFLLHVTVDANGVVTSFVDHFTV